MDTILTSKFILFLIVRMMVGVIPHPQHFPPNQLVLFSAEPCYEFKNFVIDE
jgi:hypothetical protein